MGLFGRRSRRDEREPELVEDELNDDDYDDHIEGSLVSEFGPYDESEVPDDGMPRLDLGGMRLPYLEGTDTKVEFDEDGKVNAVHVFTPYGRLTVNAYAAPRSGELWLQVCGELAVQLRGDGAVVHSESGDWGQELVAMQGDTALRFIGFDGDRWMLRGVVLGPADRARQGTVALRELMRGTVVVRGTAPMPAGTHLPIVLPDAVAAYIDKVRAEGEQA